MTLSDKIHIGYEKNLKVEDVKEAINELKEMFKDRNYYLPDINEILNDIDEMFKYVFGEELLKQKLSEDGE